MKSKAKNISITPFVKLQCSKTDVKYISLGYSAGKYIMVDLLMAVFDSFSSIKTC